MSVKFEDYHIQIENAIKEKAWAYLEESAEEIHSQTVRNCATDGGRTKDSFEHVVDESELVAYVGSNYENAIWEEFGTGIYAVNGDGRQDAWYVPVDSYHGKKQPTYNGRVIIVYGKNGAKFYKTNGKKPKRMLFNAFQSLRSALIRRAEEVFKEL